MKTIQIGNLHIRRLILGGNPFSGFSHLTPDLDRDMLRYFTVARIKETLHQAEAAGIDTFLGRADAHIRRMLLEYWDEGGAIKWFAQTCPEFASLEGNVNNAINTGAAAVYLHGGQMDFFYAQKQFDSVKRTIAQIKEAGRPAGIAGHNPRVHEWADEHLDVDFHMCSYYNPTPRDENAEHVHGAQERFDDGDRDAMVAVIQHLRAPAIHYKVFAAGRKEPRAAFAFVAQHLRPQDAVCIGVYPKQDPTMIETDVRLFEQIVLQEP